VTLRYDLTPEQLAEAHAFWREENESRLRRYNGAVILTDVDETVLEYARPFQEWCEAKGIPTYGNLRDIYSVEDMLGCDHLTAVDLMVQFTNEGGLDEQPVEEDCVEHVQRLHRAGYRFVAITACGLDLSFQKARKKRLEDVFGFKWDAMHVVDLRATKRYALNAYDSAIWVEDNHGHAVAGSELGHRSFLLNRTYNRVYGEHEGIERVDTWRDIATKLLG
jgi:hypothetical protein